MSQFSVPIPKEEAMNNMIYMNTAMMRRMKPEVLHQYLDELEKQKEERKSSKQINTNNKI